MTWCGGCRCRSERCRAACPSACGHRRVAAPRTPCTSACRGPTRAGVARITGSTRRTSAPARASTPHCSGGRPTLTLTPNPNPNPNP
eukprot:scaffold65003_cov61-Phaeocystis_antarctica.AAC.5